MANKAMKPVAPVATKPAPMTEEEIKRKQTEFLMQKRESFAQGILYNLCQSCGRDVFWDRKNEDAKNIHIKMVESSVEMADKLLDVLYGVSFVKKDKPEQAE